MLKLSIMAEAIIHFLFTQKEKTHFVKDHPRHISAKFAINGFMNNFKMFFWLGPILNLPYGMALLFILALASKETFFTCQQKYVTCQINKDTNSYYTT
jgi:hypothetical protein